MSQIADSTLDAGREAVRHRDWETGYRLLAEADGEAVFAPEDLELYADAAMWVGR